MTTRRIGGGRRVALPLLASWLAAACLCAATVYPPKPDRYFNDQAGIVDASTASELNDALAQFERDTSDQIVVATYPSLPPGVDAAQYCVLTGRAWGVGQAGSSQGAQHGDNGAILFVFVQDHKIQIVTGYGLEGQLPDITCQQIIDNEITPSFKQGDYAGGLRAGVAAMMAAAKGEYKGTGQTVRERQDELAAQRQQEIITGIVIAIFVIAFFTRGLFPALAGGPYIYTGGGFGSGFGGGWGGGGGGFGGGGGGGFSGGGGSFGGGGAGGSW